MINVSDMEAEAAGVLPNRSIYFGTTDAEGSVEKAKSLWATVIVEPTDIPDVGRFAVHQDTQGAF